MAKDDPTREGLAFFGRVSAVISHDLKNVMATISETAGLLGDLVDLAGEGRALDPNELKSCSETIIDEIQRGYVTIGLLNAFAHSADQPLKEVDLAEMVTLAVNLSQCLSYARRVERDRGGGPAGPGGGRGRFPGDDRRRGRGPGRRPELGPLGSGADHHPPPESGRLLAGSYLRVDARQTLVGPVRRGRLALGGGTLKSRPGDPKFLSVDPTPASDRGRS
jgi:hypothetical protein